MVDARDLVKSILEKDSGVSALCSNIHTLRAPVNNKVWPCIVIREEDNVPSMADNEERASLVSMQVWLWASTETAYISLIQAVNSAMMGARWIRAGVKPDNYVPAPHNLFEKMLVFERALKITRTEE